MKAVGVIVEYNPFHNGHKFHLEAARSLANSDIVIAVMSGNFLQRGEPALVSKWYRTLMALQNGVDIVFELPYRYAVQKAETFANGAVSILDAAGCSFLCFGSESGDITKFERTIDHLEVHKDHFDKYIKNFIATGVSYPRALNLAFDQLNQSEGLIDLAKPNNILGFEYMKAIHEQNSQLKALTITRNNSNYHDEHFASSTIASATSIRKAIFSGEHGKSSISQYIPEPTRQILEEYYSLNGMFLQWEEYWPYLQYRLISAGAEEINRIYEVEEGLEHRLKSAVLTCESFQEFMKKIKTKRYTWTRLQRLCVHILTNAQKSAMANTPEKAGYLRLLGMTAAGKTYLNRIKKQLPLPIVTNLARFKHEDLLLDIQASRVYSLGLPNPLKIKRIKQEYQQPPIFLPK